MHQDLAVILPVLWFDIQHRDAAEFALRDRWLIPLQRRLNLWSAGRLSLLPCPFPASQVIRQWPCRRRARVGLRLQVRPCLRRNRVGNWHKGFFPPEVGGPSFTEQ